MSTDITAVAVRRRVRRRGGLRPRRRGPETAEAAGLLWDAASRRAAESGDGGLEHVVVPVAGGVVAVVEAHGHRAVAFTGPRPAVALLLFDLRTCLGDAFAAGEEAQ